MKYEHHTENILSARLWFILRTAWYGLMNFGISGAVLLAEYYSGYHTNNRDGRGHVAGMGQRGGAHTTLVGET
jgi:hypothetical protein